MYRLVVCLLFYSVFQNGITLSQQDDTTTTETVTKASTEEPKKSNSTEIPNKSSIETTTVSVQKTDEEARRGNDAEDSDSDTDYTTKKTRDGTFMENLEPPMTLRPNPKSKTKTKTNENDEEEDVNYPSKFMVIQEKLTKAVAKGVEGAKEMADGAYNFLRDAVTGIF